MSQPRVGMQTPASGGGGVRRGGTVADTTAVNSHVTTSGWYADAGIGGGGEVDGGGTVAKTTAVYSNVKTKGRDAKAGIGGGGGGVKERLPTPRR
ncbi:hypothetical protein [Endozoicomonas sp. GU-1]|uniref:hypothetical protein n=1 Tax=Endozoicomonas sp. GU-1 TaxID=3009078 RepID=UPI0022B31C2E|nr:hypothetical protein [Endozoicomonas sp. GU-1]WBA86754.1 hypothetical protein O3276_01535 [Endozoicomonas sp. GU-1]